MGGIAEPLERVLILIPVGVLANDEVPDCDSSVRSTDACHLPNDPTGAFDVMERQPANHDVERVGRTRDVLGVTSDEVDVLCLPFSLRLSCDFERRSRQIYSDHRLTAIGEAERHVTGAGSDLEYAVARVDVSCFNQASDSLRIAHRRGRRVCISLFRKRVEQFAYDRTGQSCATVTRIQERVRMG